MRWSSFVFATSSVVECGGGVAGEAVEFCQELGGVFVGVRVVEENVVAFVSDDEAFEFCAVVKGAVYAFCLARDGLL